MKIVAIILMVSVLLVGCSKEINTQPISATKQDGDFKVTLYADNAVYHKDKKINVWANLLYNGKKESITVWHSKPLLAFSIKDDNGLFKKHKFFFDAIGMSTNIKKGIAYNQNYVKKGGWNGSDPNADFYDKFYSEPNLYLPVGKYTIAIGAFFEIKGNPEEKFEIIAELPIQVVK
ncbi:hypothetical protein [Ammoniphilus sp. 3BR4]|uniref:hypothetical protein n=1 Tax=Ammoniphilus sp. 3BR4 TaxID=3158265 RepID=UPI003466AA05